MAEEFPQLAFSQWLETAIARLVGVIERGPTPTL
jgi:hypothetical protein